MKLEIRRPYKPRVNVSGTGDPRRITSVENPHLSIFPRQVPDVTSSLSHSEISYNGELQLIFSLHKMKRL